MRITPTPPWLNMKRLLFLVILAINVPRFACAQGIPIIDLYQLEARLNNGADTTFVINFWATWCGPCVKELPYFEKLGSDRADEKFRILLVTLDFAENLDSKVVPFVLNKQIKSEVLLLDEDNPNKWIPRVSQEWSGAIPASIFINNKKKTRHFHEGSFEKSQLKELLSQLGL